MHRIFQSLHRSILAGVDVLPFFSFFFFFLCMGTYDLGWARLGWVDSGRVGDTGGEAWGFWKDY